MLLLIMLALSSEYIGIQGNNLIAVYILSVILFANYFRVRKPKKAIEDRKASFLSLFIAGLGQLYAQKKVLGFIIIILHIVLFLASVKNEDIFYFYILIGVTILSAVHAHYSGVKMNRKLLKNLLQETAVLKYLRIKKVREETGVDILPDTNILMHEPLMLVAAFRDSDLKLYISKQVMKELDGLKNSDHPGTRKSAQIAFDLLEMYQSANRLKFVEIPNKDYLKKHKLSESPDEKIIGSCLQLLEKQTPVIFVSNDKGARILARNSNVPTLTLE